MKLTFKDIRKINHLMEIAEENDTTIVIGKEGHHLYLMNGSAFSKMQDKQKETKKKKQSL